MKRAFVRGLWGIYSTDNALVERRYKMDSDIKQTLNNKFTPPFITYVFGDDNLKYLEDHGVENLKLLSKDPFRYELAKHQYRHKLEIYKVAMEDFDEIVYIDWDVTTKNKLPSDFWEVMGKKEYCQANLQQYKRKKCPWRGKGQDVRKIPNGGFLYIRDKTFPDDIIRCWDRRPGNSDEPAIAKAIDERYGGWMGVEEYWKLHEPEFCNLWKFSAYPKEMINKKRITFIHHQGLPSCKYSKHVRDKK